MAGTGQRGTPGYRLDQEIVVEVRDETGKPMQGVAVSFEADDPTSYLEPRSDSTDDQGQARTWWRMGGTLGSQRLTARVAAPGVEAVSAEATASGAGVVAITEISGHLLCGIARDGGLSCWTYPTVNQPNPTEPPSQILPGTKFTSLAYSQFLACATTEAGRAWCWKATGSPGEISAPTEVAGAYPPMVQLVGLGNGTTHGEGAFCGLTADGQGWCWGENQGGFTTGILGVGDTVDHLTPVPLATDQRFESIHLGVNGGCALTMSHEAWCWGENRLSESSDSPDRVLLAPDRVSTSLRFREVVRFWTGNVSCGIAESGGMYCWGYNANLSPTREEQISGPIPQPIPGTANAVHLTLDRRRMFVLRQDGSGYWSGNFAPFADGLISYLQPIKLTGVMRDFVSSYGLEIACGHDRTSNAVLCQSSCSLLYPTAYGSHVEDLPFFLEPGQYALPPVVGIPVR